MADVTVLPDFRLAVRFRDGTSGEVDMSAFLSSPDPGVFAPLRDPEFFAKAYVNLGAITWPGELDLAPDAMYDQIRTHGRWVIDG